MQLCYSNLMYISSTKLIDYDEQTFLLQFSLTLFNRVDTTPLNYIIPTKVFNANKKEI